MQAIRNASKWKCGHRGLLTREKKPVDATGEGNPGAARQPVAARGERLQPVEGGGGPQGE